MNTNKAPQIDQLEMTDADVAFAERIARRLGYEQTAYTSSSALWGLFCLRDNPEHIGKHTFQPVDPVGYDSNCVTCDGKCRDSVHSMLTNFAYDGCIIKTKQFGFLFVMDLEDMHFNDLHE